MRWREKATTSSRLCDVDDNYAAKKFAQYPKAKQFKDFRVMLDKMGKEIDAVVIGTPDHTHAVIAMEAMKRGKHVYCEKPLAHTVHEVRALMAAAQKYKVVTQLGNQGHSSGSIRRLCEWVWAGAIGQVHTVHAGCDAFKDVYCQLRNLDKLDQTLRCAQGPRLRSLDRPGAVPPLHALLGALELARLDAVRHRHHRRLVLPRDRSLVLGAGPGRARPPCRPR